MPGTTDQITKPPRNGRNRDDRPLVVVLGLSPTGLYAVRELRRAGFPVLGVTAGFATGSWSRHATEGVIDESDPARLLERLLAVAAGRELRPVLVPTADRFVEFVIEHHAALTEAFDFAPAYADGTAALLLDKERFYAECARHGLAHPRSWTIDAPAVGRERVDEMAFPALLKPALTHRVRRFLRGRKAIVVRDAADFLATLATLPFSDSPWVAQEIVPGPDSNLLVFGGYFDRSGRPAGVFTGRKLRQWPPGFGSASLALSSTEAAVRDLSIRFLGSLGFRGLCGTEFKRDPRDGRLVVMEINPRPTLWFQLAGSSGVPLAEIAVRDLAGLPVPPSAPQRDGVAWRYVGPDLAAALAYATRRVSVLPAPDTRRPPGPRTWPVWDPRDPLPAAAELLSTARAVWRRRAGKVRSEGER